MASGKHIDHLNAILHVFFEFTLLDKLGCQRKGALPRNLALTKDHPMVIEQDELTRDAARLTISMFGRRSRSMAWFDGFPGMFAVFGGDKPDHIRAKPRVFEAMREAKIDQQVIERGTGSFWKKLQTRSPFVRPHTWQMMKLADRCDFKADPENKEEISVVAQKQWSSLSQSKLIEDGFRDQRVEESCRRSFNKYMSGPRTLMVLIKAGTEFIKHRFFYFRAPLNMNRFDTQFIYKS